MINTHIAVPNSYQTEQNGLSQPLKCVNARDWKISVLIGF